MHYCLALYLNKNKIWSVGTKRSYYLQLFYSLNDYAFKSIQSYVNTVDAILSIKESYRIQRNWVGDPCEPKNYSWEGLKCNYSTSLPPRIISLNMSSSSLSGIITSAISNLSSLESLDLHNNSLTGTMPQFLEELKSLKYLDLKDNQFSGSVPTILVERSRDGLLTLRVDDQNLGDSGGNNKTKEIVIPIVVSVSVLVIVVAFILFWKLRRNERSDEEISTLSKGGTTVTTKNWQYSYSEVLDITNNFEMAIGKGGFGTVYCGKMKDGKQVAVKMLSPSSSQGPKEFQTEAELLMTVHHKIWEFRTDNQDQQSQVIHSDATNEKSAVMGTTGYLDPEYYKLGTLNEKSDIYSFGIVLLELLTGRPAILKGNGIMHILEWIRPELERQDLSKIIDPRLQGKFDASSGWKALGIAMACSTSTSTQRPTMSVVIAELKQCLKLESPSDTSEKFVAPQNKSTANFIVHLKHFPMIVNL
ncbi:hypothetical protein JHK82_043353 [Glycine max]|nr:hypothetical protein JHK82_043353 [Glycine max]